MDIIERHDPVLATPAGMSPEEWQARCDLAACYQLVDLFGMSDMTASHTSAAVPGSEHFLLSSPHPHSAWQRSRWT